MSAIDFASSDAETPLLFTQIVHPTHDSDYGSRALAQSFPSAGSNKSRSIQSHTASEDDDVTAPSETPGAGRNLGWGSAYILIISRVIGSGIFATPGAIASSAGSIGLSLLLWVVGALISWCGLAVSLEYGCMLPRSGGYKVYLEFTYPRPRFLASTLVTVHAVVLGFTASNCIVFGEYLLFALGKTPSAHRLEVRVLAVGLMTAITVTHGCFRQTGILVQNILGWVKVGLIVFVILASGLVVAGGHWPSHDGWPESELDLHQWPAMWDGIWEGSVWNWGVLSTALFKVFYSYAGLDNVNNVLNEVRDPVRTLPSASLTALGTACLLYLLINVAYFLVVPLQDIKDSGELIAALFFERILGQSFGRFLLPLAVAISAAGNVMVVTFSLARLNQEIARQGFLPLGEMLSSSKPFGSPMGGLIVHYIPSVIVICIPYDNIYSFILDVEGYPGQFFVLAISLGLIWLRWTRPNIKRPYRAFLPVVWFRVIISLALLSAPFVSRRGEDWNTHISRVSYALVGTSVIAFGVLYWLVLAVILPWLGGYRLDEATVVLEDGASVTKLIHVREDDVVDAA
ncbi:hypothetical protein VTK26DRAFT_6509 [Humicola hyalothermophila]